MNDEYQASWTEQDSGRGEALAAPAAQRQAAVPLKQIVTIRLDVDTLNWFKAGGPGYQTRINQLLREHMDEAIKAAEAH